MTPTAKITEYYNHYKEKLKVNQRVIYTVLFYMSMVFAGSMAFYWYTTTTNLDKKSNTLSLLTSYSMNSLTHNESIKDVVPLWRSLSDVFMFNDQLTTTITNNQNHRTRLSLPFDNFLQLFYMPSLNIWRDPFSQKIDTTIIGKKYLDINPYWDIALMEKWTDFFKDVWLLDSFNTINNITIWNIETEENWYFSLNIKVDFESPDKRSFLLLVNKLSMTAYLENISLINEFVFYIWDNIKTDRKDFLLEQQTILSDTLPYVSWEEDRLIGYLIYNWVMQWGENTLISTDIINKAIRQTAWCIDEDQRKCNYLFRQKTRNIPYLSYGIWRDGVDTVEWFKVFFQNIPPLLSIDQFSFEEMRKTRLNTSSWYKWSITIKVYGKDIRVDEINTIWNELGLMCFVNKDSMTVWAAKLILEKQISDLWRQIMDTRRSTILNQVVSFINNVEKEYETLPNYKKVVRLFELYRTLKENNLCDIIDSETTNAIENNISIDDNFDETDVVEQIINPVLSGSTQTGVVVEEPIVDTLSGSSSVPEVITGSMDDRTIGDGNSSRDQQLANELWWLEE